MFLVMIHQLIALPQNWQLNGKVHTWQYIVWGRCCAVPTCHGDHILLGIVFFSGKLCDCRRRCCHCGPHSMVGRAASTLIYKCPCFSSSSHVACRHNEKGVVFVELRACGDMCTHLSECFCDVRKFQNVLGVRVFCWPQSQWPHTRQEIMSCGAKNVCCVHECNGFRRDASCCLKHCFLFMCAHKFTCLAFGCLQI